MSSEMFVCLCRGCQRVCVLVQGVVSVFVCLCKGLLACLCVCVRACQRVCVFVQGLVSVFVCLCKGEYRQVCMFVQGISIHADVVSNIFVTWSATCF